MNKETLAEVIALLNTANYDTETLNHKRDEVVSTLKKQLSISVVMFNETEICTTCLKPRNMHPNILQPLCECDISEVKLVCDNCYGTGVSKSDLNSITTCSNCLGSGKQTN